MHMCKVVMLQTQRKYKKKKKIDKLQYLSQLRKYESVLEDIRRIPFYKKSPEQGQTGSGISIFSDPNEMVERLELLIASKNSGNDSTEVYEYNECVQISDKLLKMKLMKKLDHKRIFSKLFGSANS
jgi:hypothetical protein